ncbi:hypothetical protein ACLOJK_010127 [Asimina triloba]
MQNGLSPVTIRDATYERRVSLPSIFSHPLSLEMDRYKAAPQRRVHIQTADVDFGRADEEDRAIRVQRTPKEGLIDEQEPFMGVKVRRKASLHRDYKGDYIDVPSHPYLIKILEKQGDRQVLFADKILKFTGSGKMKRRILVITDFAIYIVDPEANALKRRIALAAVDKLCLSELSDNFFAIIIPSEYDCLMASTRKTEIVTVLVDATKSTSEYELEVAFSNRFEYNAAADLVKEVQFEEVEVQQAAQARKDWPKMSKGDVDVVEGFALRRPEKDVVLDKKYDPQELTPSNQGAHTGTPDKKPE